MLLPIDGEEEDFEESHATNEGLANFAAHDRAVSVFGEGVFNEEDLFNGDRPVLGFRSDI